jgi:hypothetical protein
VIIIVKLHITKTDNHFGYDNSYEISDTSLVNAVNKASALVPFPITTDCLSNLEKNGVHQEDEYIFKSYDL